jgi:hypothetical protein
MKVLYQRGHFLKNKEETSKLHANYHITLETVDECKMCIRYAKGTEKENICDSFSGKFKTVCKVKLFL